MLPRAAPFARRAIGSLAATGRSPDLASRARIVSLARLAADGLPDNRTSGTVVGSFDKHHSGGTVRDSHPLPYSPHLIGAPEAVMNLSKEQCSE